MEKELTSEEQAAFDAMKAEDTAPEQEAPQDDTPQEEAAPVADEQQEPEAEFKTSRKEEFAAPDWETLDDATKANIQRVLNGKPPEGFVPHGAMHANRETVKELKAEIDALKASMAPKEENAEPEWVDPIIDPEGNRKWVEHQFAKLNGQTQDAQKAQEQARAQAERQVKVQQAEQQFMQTTPDYMQAAEHLMSTRKSHYAAQGYGDAEIMQRIGDEANKIFQAAELIGENPAKLVYQRAMEAGYSKGPSEADKIKAQAKAQQQTRGMGSGGGGDAPGKYTAEMFAEMTAEELAKVPRDEFRRVMGG